MMIARMATGTRSNVTPAVLRENTRPPLYGDKYSKLYLFENSIFCASVRSHHISWFSHVPNRNAGPSVLTPWPYNGRWTGNDAINVLRTASATPYFYPVYCVSSIKAVGNTPAGTRYSSRTNPISSNYACNLTMLQSLKHINT